MWTAPVEPSWQRGILWRVVVAAVLTVGASGPSACGSHSSSGSGDPVDAGPSGTATWRGKPLFDRLFTVCTWASACGVSSFPPSTGACAASFRDEWIHGGGLNLPWDELEACVEEGPSGCDALRACLTKKAALCPGGVSVRCPTGALSCDPSCLATCSVAGVTCSADGKSRLACDKGVTRFEPCALRDGPVATCVPGKETGCRPGTAATCSTPGLTCDGSVAVSCLSGQELRQECSVLGGTCKPGDGCQYPYVCPSGTPDSCSGTVLTMCLAGSSLTYDCKAVGATCGSKPGVAATCVFGG